MVTTKLLWNKVKEDANEMMGELDCEIFASDRSEKAIAMAKKNLKHAGLHKDIDIKVAFLIVLFLRREECL